MGLDQVRDLSGRAQERILRRRPFHSLEEFLLKVDPRQQEAENLALAGALEGLGSIPDLLQRIHRGISAPGQMRLFAWDEAPLEDWTVAQKSRRSTGHPRRQPGAHPLELAAAQISAAGAISTVEAAAQTAQRVTVAGLRFSSHRSRTVKGEMMMFLTLEDLEGTLDVILFPDVYRKAKEIVSSNAPLLVTGIIEVDESRGEPLLKAEKVEAIQMPVIG